MYGALLITRRQQNISSVSRTRLMFSCITTCLLINYFR